MREILLTQNKIALIDDIDYDRVAQYNWCAWWNGHNWYAEHRTSTDKIEYMHNFILPVPEGYEVDHIDNNGLNNQGYNLRVATHAQNMMNRVKAPGCTSKYKGVCWYATRYKWIVSIKANYKQIHLGYFTDEVEAARAYDRAAIKYFGSYARLNFPHEYVPTLSIPYALCESPNDGRYAQYA